MTSPIISALRVAEQKILQADTQNSPELQRNQLRGAHLAILRTIEMFDENGPEKVSFVDDRFIIEVREPSL